MPKIIFLGCGLVATCILEMFAKFPIGKQVMRHYKKILILDKRDKTHEPTLAALRKDITIQLVQIEITPENITEQLLNHVKRSDLFIDLSYNIPFKPIICKCLAVGAHYINTSTEHWLTESPEQEGDIDINFHLSTLHESHDEYTALASGSSKKQNSSILLINGANPGLISQFGKMGIYKISCQILRQAQDAKIKNDSLHQLKKAVKAKDFPMMAYLLDLQVLECSETDTQVANTPRKSGEFPCTWSPYSFFSEAVDKLEIGFGTHEEKMPHHAVVSYGEPNEIYLPVRGMDMVSHSFAYDRPITGMLIPHSENDTQSRRLTLKDKQGKVIYRPSVYYTYSPMQDTLDAFREVRNNSYVMLPAEKPLRGTDIQSGADILGSLLSFGSNPIEKLLYGKIDQSTHTSYWIGSALSIEQTRAMGFEHSGPTTCQVAISILTAIKYMLKHPHKGLMFPEDLPFDTIYKECVPFLGTVFADFVPYRRPTTQFTGYHAFLTSKTTVEQPSGCAIM